jgi:uncharacterized protein YfaS (alpha-2-macroglobulin family)
MNAVARFRAAGVTMALIVAVVACSQGIDVRRFVNEVAQFALTPAGDEVARLTPVTVTFPNAPSERDGESVLQLSPKTAGSYAWLSPRTLLFQPDFPGLLRGATYTATVAARPEAGLPAPVTKRFTVTGKLAVQQIIPADRDTDVPLTAQVFVQFSRSVAPLTTLAEQPTGAVVTFDPPLRGKGEWLNTSIYRFMPTDLQANQTYTATVAKGLSSAADGVLESDFRSTFTTVGPAVDSIVPDAAWQFGGPWQEAVVTFNQPMDEAAATGVVVKNAATGAVVPGKRTWNDARTVLTFNPSERMERETRYTIAVAQGLKGARGGVTKREFTSSFTTVGLPTVQQTQPASGDQNAGRFGVNIQFKTPMDVDSLEGKLSISGLGAADLEGRISIYEQAIGASVTLEPRTAYTVRLAAGAMDRYGQVMGAFAYSFVTGALPSSVGLAIPGYGRAGIFSSTAEPFLWYQTTNLTTVEFTLYPLDEDEGWATMHSHALTSVPPGGKFTPKAQPIRTWTERIAEAKDQVVLQRTSISGGGALPKGYYYVETSGAMRSMFAFAVVDTVLVMKISNNELVAWAVDHDTGAALPGVNIHAKGGALGEADAITDRNGLVTFAIPRSTPGNYQMNDYWLSMRGRKLAVASSHWQSASPYQYGLPMEFGAREWVGHTYSDRPIYRPGESVLMKGILRADDDAQYTLPPTDRTFPFVLRNSRGQELLRTVVTLSEFGSFEAIFDLPADASTGDYWFSIESALTRGYQIAGSSFVVSEFRKPEFQVEPKTEKTSYTSGDTIAAQVSASFFFGGAVAGAKVEWTALAEPHAIRPKGFEMYSFTDFDYYRQAVARDAVRAKGSATTGADGAARFSVPAVLNASEGAQRYTIGAGVTDQNGQAVGAGLQVTVHPASLYAGIRPATWVASVGSDTGLQLVTVDTDGLPLANKRVVVRVYDRQWITTKVLVPGGGRKYQSDFQDLLLATLGAITGGDATATVYYRPTKPGTLRFVAEVTDDKGRTARSAAFLWASGQGFASWQVTNDDTIKLVPDRDRYEVGDTAEVLVPAPFAGATALITVERGKIITREVRVLPTNSERLRIPITDRAVPDVFVSVVLYRGPTPTDPLPRYKIGYAQLPVSTATRQLTVKITPDRAQAKPGETVGYSLKVTDSKGKGVRSEVSVAIVDKAILALQEERGVDGLRAFWFERGLGVMTYGSMSVSLDRYNDAVAELPRIGKGGAGGGLQGDRAREDFRNTAYWDAQLVTDENGNAHVEVLMPDDLTTWRMQARAISGDTMVGEGLNELVSTKPILLRSALPRFLRVGDTPDLRVLVRNGTAKSDAVTVTMKADGVDLGAAAAQTQTVPSGASVSYVWPARVPTDGPVKITVSAQGTEESDAFVTSVNAYLDVTPEIAATTGIVTTDSGLEAIYLPKFADTRGGSLAVTVRSALVGSMAGELGAFGPFPNTRREGTDLLASRVIATSAVARAEKSTGAAADRDGRITSDIAGILARQRPDGGWAWCEEAYCSSDPNMTAWVLFALGEARRDGRTIDDGIVRRGASFVLAWLNRPNLSTEPTVNTANQSAFLLAALAASGGGAATNLASALIEQHRSKLADWGRAYLVNALLDSGVKADDPQIRMLANDLIASTIPSASGNHWENTGDSSKTSWMTSVSTTALVALAFARAQPDHQLLGQSVRWLVVARGAQGWHTFIDRAFAVLALSTYATKTGELGGDYSYKVSLDDKQILAGLVKPGGSPVEGATKIPLDTITPGKTSLLALDRSGAKGRLYYTLDLRYQTPAKDIDALNRGFAVSHTYSLIDAPDKPITSAKLGDTVRVTITVIASADRNYVTVEDLLPAGLEPVDTRLRTTDPALLEQLERERVAAFEKGSGTAVAPWYRWYYSPWQQVDLRDDRAVLKTDVLRKGVYEYTYYARATTTGSFFVAPAFAGESYFPEVFGRSDSGRFTVTAP